MMLLANEEATSGVAKTAELLKQNQPALHAIEAGIRLVECDEAVHSVGRGGWPNLHDASHRRRRRAKRFPPSDQYCTASA